MDRMYEVVSTFSPGLDYRPVVAMVMAAAEAVDPPLSDARLEDLRLVVTEACSNAVKVHRPDAQDRPVVVSCHADADGRFCVTVRDRGPGFDPAEVSRLPEPSDPRRLDHESGLGVQLIHELADEVHYDPAPDGTILSVAVERDRLT